MDMTAAPILVTGGTGTLGRHVVPLLREAGREVRVLSRHAHEPADGVTYVACDLRTGEGLDAAVAGVGTVLHLAGGPKGDDEATRNLVRAAQDAGVRHLVYISVIGADRVPLAWLRSKLAAERAITESGIPWTTLRAAQFHDLALLMAQKMAKLPVIPAPGGLRMQPVDAREVAARLVELTLGEPAGLVPDLVAVAPDVPFLCDFPRAAVITDRNPYREIGRYLSVHRDRRARVFETLSYFDGVHFAARATAPALFSTALEDETCPPSTVFAAYNAYAGSSRQIEVYDFNAHDGGGPFQQVSQLRWFAERLGAAPAGDGAANGLATGQA